MRRISTVLFALVVVVVLSATTAIAHKSHRANTYKATLASTGVTPATGPTGASAPTGVSGVTNATAAAGKAKAVQNKKYFKINVHVKGINTGVSYPAHVHEDDGSGCTGAGAVVIPLPNIVGNAGGNGNTKLKQRHASAARALDINKKYYVNVHNPDGVSIACGPLTAKHKGKSDRSRRGKGKTGGRS